MPTTTQNPNRNFSHTIDNLYQIQAICLQQPKIQTETSQIQLKPSIKFKNICLQKPKIHTKTSQTQFKGKPYNPLPQQGGNLYSNSLKTGNLIKPLNNSIHIPKKQRTYQFPIRRDTLLFNSLTSRNDFFFWFEQIKHLNNQNPSKNQEHPTD